jgi:hypothetical protein
MNRPPLSLDRHLLLLQPPHPPKVCWNVVYLNIVYLSLFSLLWLSKIYILSVVLGVFKGCEEIEICD